MKKAIKEVLSDGQLLSWFRCVATPIILAGIICFIFSVFTKYDIGVYSSVGLITTTLTGKVFQTKYENQGQ